MKERERQILITDKAAVIRDALFALLAEVKSGVNYAPGTLKVLSACARQGCDKLILDLRRTKEPPDRIGPGVIRNLRASQLGPVLVLAAEVASPALIHEVEVIRREHSFPRRLTSDLRAFVHMLSSTLWKGHSTADARVR